jgi:RHS repeat-associated protein
VSVILFEPELERVEQFDPDLGFYYLRARYMRPSTGRFWTMDTYPGQRISPSSLHKYLYGNGNPIRYKDPSGRLGVADVSAASSISLTIRSAPAVSGTAALGQATITSTAAANVAFGTNIAIASVLFSGGTAAIFGGVGGYFVYQVSLEEQAAAAIAQQQTTTQVQNQTTTDSEEEDGGLKFVTVFRENHHSIIDFAVRKFNMVDHPEGGYVTAPGYRSIAEHFARRYSTDTVWAITMQAELWLNLKRAGQIVPDPNYTGGGAYIIQPSAYQQVNLNATFIPTKL